MQQLELGFRGAVRPPFIEGLVLLEIAALQQKFRGAVRPPFIEGRESLFRHIRV